MKFSVSTKILLMCVLAIFLIGSIAPYALAVGPPEPGLQPSLPRIHVGRLTTGQYLSLNWAGYAVTGAAGSVSDAKGSWKVPSLTCSSRGTYVALWVGIDGFNDNTVEQTGVLGECSSGRAVYFVWYEFYPSGPVYASWSPGPGDTISAEVSYSTSTGLFTTTLTDTSNSNSFGTSQADSGAQRSSAEWITEAPSSAGQILPLANFGTAYYGYDYTGVASTCYATVSGATGSIGSFGASVQQIIMVTRSLVVKAQPSALTVDGTSFYVIWKHS